MHAAVTRLELTPRHTNALRWSFAIHRALRAYLLGAMLCIFAPLLLQGCGGGGGDTATSSNTGANTIGTAGGTVTDASGASVVVPANAFTTATTVRIAKDSTGAPALPTGLTPSGDMYMVTPHGGNFEVPVHVSIPVPAVTLLPTQQLKLAKAELGGEWVVLNDSSVVDGKLTTQVSSFSFFMPVVITFPLPIVSFAPIAIGDVTVIDCGGPPCSSLASKATVKLSVATTGNQLPTICDAASAPWLSGLNLPVPSEIAIGRTIVTSNLLRNGSKTSAVETVSLMCKKQQPSGLAPWWVVASKVVEVGRYGDSTYPALDVLSLPEQSTFVEGQFNRVQATLMGGAFFSNYAGGKKPTVKDTATIDWQRSDDDGLSWRNIARSYQYEASPRPFGLSISEWLYWVSTHGFTASAADNGALIRVNACYTPPDAPPPPCVTSNATRLNVISSGAVAAITQAPHSVLVRTSQTASFSATASGTPAPTLQWQSRPANSTGAWTNVASGTGGSTGNYTTDVLALSDNGLQLRVVATNAVSSVESSPVTVSVSDVDVAPTISTQPGSLNVSTGNDAAFAIAARGTEALSYQWQYNGTAIAGANSPVLRLAAVTAGQAGSYSVVVRNGAGTITSNAATLSVSAGTPSSVAPTIVTQPVAVVVNAGNTATLAVGVSGTGPFSYQWLRDGTPVAGATAAFYSIPSASAGDAGSYSVRVSNAAASNVTSSAATLQVNPSAQATAPTLTTQPSPQVQAPGGSATFAVAASGTGPLSYQWQKDGASITGATSAVLVVNGIISGDAGNYTVTVYNAQGSVTSNAASLTVLGAPSVTAQPAAATASEGATATFSVQASGSALGYQWMRNQVAVSGATSASYTSPALAMSDNGAVYSVVVYNGAGVAVSQSAVLTVTIAPPPPTVGLTAKAVAAGYGNSFAVDLDGTVWAWGSMVDPVTGGYKAISPWATRPVKVQGLSGVKSITAVSKWGGSFDLEGSFYALHDNGTVSAWGANRFGELGDRSTTTRNLPVPVMQDAANRMTGICKIAGGSYALVMAPCAAGTVWLAGTLSTNPASVSAGFTFSAVVPTAIPGLPGTKIVKTLAMPQALASSAVNSQSALLIVYDNETVLAWGDQVSNSLGAGVNADVAGSIAGPVSVWPALGSVEDARLGVGFSILQGVDFRLKAIGSDMDGRLGVGGLSDQTAPISVAVLDTVSRFSVGQADAAAIQNGQLWIWGFNNANVLRSPTRLGSESSYTEVSVGVSHGLAIGAGGVVSAWGSGTWGALGNNQPSAALPEVVVRP